ncbi:LOW QUALITY PROTEIN: mas-related G-protein coupled receptor member H-like [Sceloporus undulatus]|uniref:LOW QUALITY PROTEIN: mas-related G-protein coupled receptor member H-like n=1 Tax=Sceloporus undulatus TaxID=8520 RepID=UPI001C4A8F13|nr:LOW QUALITY PROTEIN: mas-related G-protein coupled receptor member H-like [Sceloporus undulatus]
MVTTFNLSVLSSLDARMDDNGTHNSTIFHPNSSNNPDFNISRMIGLLSTSTIILLVASLDFGGNGLVIWLLGFCIKRNPFTTYILNLSIADFGVLTALAVYIISCIFYWFYDIDTVFLIVSFEAFFLFTFTTSQFLLTVISIDRCVCLFFPLWHRCHRPPHLSTTVCVIIWILSFLLSATFFALSFKKWYDIKFYQFVLNALLFTPVMSVSTITMLIKICLISKPYKRRKPLTAILLSLLFFLLFAFPLNAVLSLFLKAFILMYVIAYGYICVSLNSSINPLIYFLVGRKKRGRSRERIKKIFEEMFKEEENCTEEVDPPKETKL